MQVPLLDLKAQYVTIKKEVLEAVSEVLDSQRCIGGRKVIELEEKIAAISNCKFAVGASSGTDAILNSLMSLDISAGDEVITTPFTFFATVGEMPYFRSLTDFARFVNIRRLMHKILTLCAH